MGAFRIGTGALEAYDTISKFGKGLEKQKEARDSIFDNTPGLDLFQLLGDDELTKKGNPKNKKGTVKGADGNWYRKTSFDELKEKAKKVKSLDFDLDKELNINKQLTELDLLNWGNNIGFDLDTAKSKIPKFDYSKTRIPFYDTMLEFDHDDLVQKGLMDSNGLKNSFEEFSMYQDIVAEMRDTSKTGNKPGLLQRLFGGAKKGGSKALGAADDVAGKVTGLTSTSLMGAVSAGGEMAATATAGAVTGGGGTVGSIGGVASGVIGSGGTAGIVGSAVATAAPLIAIAAILAGAYTQSEKFRKSVKNFADTSLSGVTSGFEKVKDGIKKGWEAAQPFVDVLKEGLKNIGDLLAPVLNFLGPIVDGFFNIVGMGIGAVFEGIGTF